MAQAHIGGSFAPQITDLHLARYRLLAEEATPPVRDVMLALCKMVEVFHQTPPSKMNGHPHPVGTGLIVPLEPAEVERMDPHVPWAHELEAYAQLFEGIDPVGSKEIRDGAHHLLWYAVELNHDREPGTVERMFPRET